MAPAYKLSYFDIRGLGEPIRLLMVYGGLEYEDFRFSKDEWPSIKPSTPFGKVPVLEFDGKKAHQTAAICRYVAKQIGLAGSNDWEGLQIDMIVDTYNDFCNYIYQYREANEDEKPKKLETLKNETIPYYMSKFDELIKQNGGYLVSGKLTWADIYIIPYFETLNYFMNDDLLVNYSNVKALYEKIQAIPAIKAWVAKRPDTEY